MKDISGLPEPARYRVRVLELSGFATTTERTEAMCRFRTVGSVAVPSLCWKCGGFNADE